MKDFMPSAIIQVTHVYPVNDIHKHDLEYNIRLMDTNEYHLEFSCDCKPKSRWVPCEDDSTVMGLTIIHNSFDGREGVEWVNVLIKFDRL